MEAVKSVAVQDIQACGVYRWKQIQDTVCMGLTQRTIGNWISTGKFPRPIGTWTHYNIWRGKDLIAFMRGEYLQAEQKKCSC